jgi:hypothetical protein
MRLIQGVRQKNKKNQEENSSADDAERRRFKTEDKRNRKRLIRR